MALDNATKTVAGFIGGLVSVLKALIVFFVFANIIYPMTGFDPVVGIIDLVRNFLGGGLAGLIALLVFVSIMDK